ncbi:MAG: GerMN domain-containing protein [Lachnospiraceae bacterium]|nr:GerMN domain-containing protein [Lachnospiraceae bacterium]
MKYKLFSLGLILFNITLLLSGCSFKKKNVSHSGYYLYYIDTSESNIVKKEFEPKSDKKDEIIKEIFSQISSPTNNIEMKQVISGGIEVEDFVIDENNNITIYFNSRYSDNKGAAEVLRRAAIVKNLTQIDGIESVQFYVAGQPLTDGNDTPIGYMTSDDFVDNSNGETGYTEKTLVNLYYANKEGDKLIRVPVRIEYDSSVPIEQMVVELLINGPKNISGVDSEDLLPTIPKGTVINKIAIKGNTCNIDFSKEFLNKNENLTNEVAVYSVVNTLTERPNINKVQFSIDGEPQLLYNEVLDFGGEFERNLDILE